MANALSRPVPAAALEAARSYWGFTQKQLADLVASHLGQDFPEHRVRDMESGRSPVRAELVPVLAEVLEVPESFLLHGPSSARGRASVTVEELDGGADQAFSCWSMGLESLSGVAA